MKILCVFGFYATAEAGVWNFLFGSSAAQFSGLLDTFKLSDQWDLDAKVNRPEGVEKRVHAASETRNKSTPVEMNATFAHAKPASLEIVVEVEPESFPQEIWPVRRETRRVVKT